MVLFSVTKLKKMHGVKVIFDDCELSINSGDKIGLIGVNGTGKTSLLRIVAGLAEPDQGEILTSNELVMEYLPQNPHFDPEATVLTQIFRGESAVMGVLRAYEQVVADLESRPDDSGLIERLLVLSGQMDEQDAWQLESEAKAILHKLGISGFNDKVGTLSGGQKKRIALAGALIRPCNLLILDEPTNHLDNAIIEYLEGILKNKNCALLMVTHDRYFLDRVTNRIVEIDRGKFYEYAGNYATFLALKAERAASEGRMQEKELSLYKQELAWMRKGVEARRTKQKARKERFEELAASLPGKQDETFALSFGSARLGKKIIEIEHLRKTFGDKVCIKDLSYVVVREDRIGIVGDNGLGKSTLLNILARGMDYDSGRVAIGDTVRIGYYTQDSSDLPEDTKVIDYIRTQGEFITSGDGTQVSASKMLERFLFPGALQHSLIEKLSGGEKRRLYLLGVLMNDVNVLLLDEPTNDLDIQTLQILEAYLGEFPGPVLTVSHDRYFLDKIADHIFAFEGQGIVTIHTGNYSDYAEKRAVAVEETAQNHKEKAHQKPVTQPLAKPKVKLNYNEAKEYETIEEVIGNLEDQIAKVDQDMVAFSANFKRLGQLMTEKEQLEETLLLKMERWAYLTDIVEEMGK